MTAGDPLPARMAVRRWLPEIGLGVLAVAVLLVFLFTGIGRPLWHDDANAVLMARQNFSGLLEALRNDNNLPAYYVLLAGWIRLFGESEPALRSLSMVFYLAGAWLVGQLAFALYRSRRAAVYAALLYLASPQLVAQAQSVRMYTMLGCLSAASLLLFVRIFVREEHSDRHTWLYIAVNSVGVLTQVWFAFVLFGQLLCQVFRLRRDFARFASAGVLCACAFYFAWGAQFFHQLRSGSASWLPPFRVVYFLDIVTSFYGGPFLGVLCVLLCVAPLLAAPAGERRALWRQDAARILTFTLLACLVVPLLVTMVKPIYYSARYSTAGLPALAALLGGALARLAPRRYALALCGGILFVMVLLHVGRSEAANFEAGLPPGQSDRATAEYLLRYASPGDCVVFTNLTRPAADYYFRRHQQGERFIEISFPGDQDRHAGWLDAAELRRHPERLAEEAARTAEYLDGIARSGRRIWLYDGLPGVTEYLTSTLDRRLGNADPVDRSGPFHRRLLVYAARPGGAAMADGR